MVDQHDLCDGDVILVRAKVRVRSRVIRADFNVDEFLYVEGLDIVKVESLELRLGDLVTVPASELQASSRVGKVIAMHGQFAAVALEGVEKPIVVPTADLKRRARVDTAEAAE